MEYNKEEYISPHWPGFRRLWWIVAIILFISLIVLWFMGYGPGGKACQVPAEVEIRTVEKLVAAPDVTAPLITLNDAPTLHLFKGDKYIEPGARATDGVDGNISVISTGEVDTSKVGEYLVTYRVTDAAGNSTTETRRVVVAEPADTVAPEINLNGDAIVYLKTGDTYSDAGANASDLADGALTVETESQVDTNKAGEYVITYLVTDSAGNKSTATRKVVVIDPDNTAPIISLNDASVIFLKTGESYVEAGAKAVDTNDGSLKVITEGVVDTSKAGEYLVTYTVTDSAGNEASKTRKIVVTASDVTDPVISLKGSKVLYLERGDKYTEAGAFAEDDTDGTVTVMTGGIVDTNRVGSYLLDYSAVDKAGNKATTTRKIIVSEPVVVNVAKPTPPPVEKVESTEKPEPTNAKAPSAKLYFGMDKDNEPSDKSKSLAVVIDYLKNNGKAKANVSGYHDPTGHPAYNVDLANRRAKTVSAMLKAAGISANRIVIQKPVKTTGTGTPAEARRVEVSIAK